MKMDTMNTVSPVFSQCETDPELLKLLKKAVSHKMTDEEIRLQRESWVRGEMGLDRPSSSVLIR